jgi:hypothetical protein
VVTRVESGEGGEEEGLSTSYYYAWYGVWRMAPYIMMLPPRDVCACVI